MSRLAPSLLLALFVVVTGCAVSGCATPAAAAPAAAPVAPFEIPSPDTLHVKQGLKVVYGVGRKVLRKDVGEGLFFAERLTDAWARAGITPEDRLFVVIVYNDAAEWLLNEAAWARTHPAVDGAAPTTNPSAALVKKLQERGVQIEICGMTMKQKEWTDADLLPGVKVAPGAYSRIVDLQHHGFAYVPFF